MEELAKSVDILSRTLCDENRPELNNQELEVAKSQLIKDNLLFPRSVRNIDDPELYNQEFGLFSFTPSRNAVPDENGLYGAFKIRGNFRTVEEAEERAEYLIKNHDSYNEIFTIRVGHTVPLTKKSNLAEKINYIQLNTQIEDVVSKDVKEKRKKEEQEMKTIRKREEKLLKENDEILKGEYKEDTLDTYIMVKVKKAQLMFMLVENLKKIKTEIIPSILKARAECDDLDRAHPDYHDLYYERFRSARESVGIKDTNDMDSFLKYLGDDNDVDLEQLEEVLI